MSSTLSAQVVDLVSDFSEAVVDVLEVEVMAHDEERQCANARKVQWTAKARAQSTRVQPK